MSARERTKESAPNAPRGREKGCPTCGHHPLDTLREREHILVLGCPRCGTRTFANASA
ncbi:MAG TPA: RNA-binding protein [Candidatus Thermoplasmatota archaeon]|nr:RNA-binding protein [Candidatus Thermoplasmatota archaeon]